MTIKYSLMTGAVAFASVALAMILFQSNFAIGESFTGTSSQIDNATTTEVGPDTVVTLFSRNTECDARVITTVGQPITLSFSENITGFGGAQLSGVVGHSQGASTTIIYDSGQVGCGAFTAYATASTTITISEF